MRPDVAGWEAAVASEHTDISALCHIAAMSIDSYNKVGNFGSSNGYPFQKHHVVQKAVMKQYGNFKALALAIPLMGGDGYPGTPHKLANDFQKANVGATPLWVAENALRKAGCREDDIKIIMDEVKEQMNVMNWITP